MRVAVIGLGKLGAPLAAVLASKGNDVVGVDVNPVAVAALNDGRAPVDEPGLQTLVSAFRENLSGTTDLQAAARADVSIVLVPTPSDDRGAFSNEFVIGALEEVGRGLASHDDHHVVVVASTVMPGSCEGAIREALERSSGRLVGEAVGLCYSPEFIALGNVIRDLLAPDMVLIGESDRRSGEVVERLYSGMCENDPPIRRMSLVNAELAKIAVNTYVTMKISYANTLADMCERLAGADVGEVSDALGLDARIGRKYLQGAIGYGGPCFPRDNKAFAVLARDLGMEPTLAEATDSVNVAQTHRLARIVQSHLKAGNRAGILGLAYKPNTRVVDESQGVALARLLAEAGFEVSVYDPIATDAALSVLGGGVRPCASVEELIDRSDVVVIATPWPEFAKLPVDASTLQGRRPVVIDCWRLLADEDHAGFDIVRLGSHSGESGFV